MLPAELPYNVDVSATYGSNSIRRAGRTSEIPCRSPKRDDQARTVRGISTQVSSSLMLGRNRWMFSPQVSASIGLKRSCVKGIHISTLQPSASIDVRATHTGS